MRTMENKQKWALSVLEELRPQFLKILLGAPSFGITSVKIYWHDGEMKRVHIGCRESYIPVSNENRTNTRTDSR